MRQRIIKDEMLKANAELGTVIDLLVPSSVRQAKRKLRTARRRTRKVLNLLKPRSKQDTSPTSTAQVPPVTRPVTPPITPPLQIGRVDWSRLRREIKSGKVSYGEIARAIGKPGKWRGLIHHVVHGKRKGNLLRLVATWAIMQGYLKPKYSIVTGGRT